MTESWDKLRTAACNTDYATATLIFCQELQYDNPCDMLPLLQGFMAEVARAYAKLQARSIPSTGRPRAKNKYKNTRRKFPGSCSSGSSPACSPGGLYHSDSQDTLLSRDTWNNNVDNISDRNTANSKYSRTYFSSPGKRDDDELSALSVSKSPTNTNFGAPVRRNSKSSLSSSQSPSTRSKDIHVTDWDSSLYLPAESNAQRSPALRQYFGSNSPQGGPPKRKSLLNNAPIRARSQGRSRSNAQVQVRNTNCSECFAYRWDGCVRCDICDVVICEYCRRHHVCSIQLRKHQPLSDGAIREGVLQSSCTAPQPGHLDSDVNDDEVYADHRFNEEAYDEEPYGEEHCEEEPFGEEPYDDEPYEDEDTF